MDYSDSNIACVDGLKGLPEAVKSVFPETSIQLCVIHMIRNLMKYVSHENSKAFVADLKLIYRAATLGEAEDNLLKLQERCWEGKYPLAVKPWINHRDNIKTFFSFHEDIRRVIYTTNAVESLHRQFGKVTKNRVVFPTDEYLIKLLFLSVEAASKKWTKPLSGLEKISCSFCNYV